MAGGHRALRGHGKGLGKLDKGPGRAWQDCGRAGARGVGIGFAGKSGRVLSQGRH